MSNGIRCLIQKKITENLNIPKQVVLSHLQFQRDSTNNTFFFELPLRSKSFDFRANVNDIQRTCSNIKSNSLVNEVYLKQKHNNEFLYITIDRNNLMKTILESNKSVICPPLIDSKSENIVVEFSSPNIAKPFHVGHLRSTIIGSYLANLHKYLNNNVTKINYLGDWGLQLGFVKLGMDLLNLTIDDLKVNPLQQLYKAYVYSNSLVEKDTDYIDKARKIFHDMEHGNIDYLKDWKFLKTCTEQELEKIYSRLGVQFDEYHWESMYAFSNTQMTSEFQKNKILSRDNEGRQVINLGQKKVPIIKSDGTTLYMYRDIFAAIDRAKKYNFDKMLYVVDNSQRGHFEYLFEILKKMEISGTEKLHHVRFGKILGMSTRKGSGIFLTDILDEANAILKQKQQQSSKTKIIMDSNDNSSDILGISAIIIHDLKQRRQRDYKFSWDAALDMKGESGIKLQYTHCRLNSLKDNCGVMMAEECDPSALKEPIVDELLTLICQFDETVIMSYETLEACYMAKYLFHLSHSINKAFEQLRVKDEPIDIGSQRLLLFQVAKNILNTGMKLLCLIPLNKM